MNDTYKIDNLPPADDLFLAKNAAHLEARLTFKINQSLILYLFPISVKNMRNLCFEIKGKLATSNDDTPKDIVAIIQYDSGTSGTISVRSSSKHT